MNTEPFEDYLDRIGYDFDLDEDNDAIDIQLETSWGHPYTVHLVVGRTTYSLSVSPLLEMGENADTEALYRRLLELSDECRYVKFTLDGDGDVKILIEGFSRLDAFGQFRRRLEALMVAIGEHTKGLVKLADGKRV